MEQPKVKDETTPGSKWAFDESVTAAFDDMLERSIPQYEVMRDLCFKVGKKYVKENTAIVDLGCSRGEAIARFVDEFGAHNHFVACEVSKPMLAAARNRFSGMINCGVVEVNDVDLRTQYPSRNASLTLSVLTLQFVPMEHRQKILRKVFQHTVSGGAFVLVEKVIASSAEIDAALVDVYYQFKAMNGYSQDQIERKRLSLEGVLVPVTAAWNEQLLKGAGFAEIECFWRWSNFAAWVAVKA